jgi:hypothetical protein
MMMSVEQSVECLAVETEVLEESLPLCPPQIPHDLIRLRTRAAHRKTETNRLSYGTANINFNFKVIMFQIDKGNIAPPKPILSIDMELDWQTIE